ncbi:MAG: methyltransferase domain-containing protein, partial [Bryobacteraceae bacterium]
MDESDFDVKNAVRAKYQEAALRVIQGSASCCGPATGKDPICADLYDPSQTAGLPEQAVHASLGCGNPTALAGLEPGEVVLDLGCGGLDVFLAAQRVGPLGKVYGLDMTDEMLAL